MEMNLRRRHSIVCGSSQMTYGYANEKIDERKEKDDDGPKMVKKHKPGLQFYDENQAVQIEIHSVATAAPGTHLPPPRPPRILSVSTKLSEDAKNGWRSYTTKIWGTGRARRKDKEKQSEEKMHQN